MLFEHFTKVAETMLAKADEIGVANHATITGTARELIITELFSKNLPRGFDYVTGEIVASNSDRSGQVDILVVPQYAPRLELADPYCLAFAEAVACVVEAKSTLTTAKLENRSELRNALESIAKIRNLPLNLDPWPWTASVARTNYRLDHIPCSIVAFDGPTKETLISQLESWAEQHGKSALPNTVTCIRRNYTIVRNDDWHYISANIPVSMRSDIYIDGNDPCLYDLFVYMMKCLQAWDYARPRTPLNRYK